MYADITLKNPLSRHSREGGNLYSRAIIDRNIAEMRIPAKIALQLGLKQIEKRSEIPYVGVQVESGIHKFFTGALVMGDKVILGSIAMSEMEYSVLTLAKAA